MSKFKNAIVPIVLSQIDKTKFKSRYVGCIVLSKEGKILLQQRGVDWKTFPGFLSEFGGRIEHNEAPIQTLIRELNEELGAKVNESDVIDLGAITEAVTKYTELIYAYFWHDKYGTITGCYEGECKYFDRIEEVLYQPKLMDSARWMLLECRRKCFIF